MRTKHCIIAVVFFSTASLVFSTDIFAQPGRYRHHNGQSRHYTVRHYPQRSYYSQRNYYPQRNYYYHQPYVSVYFGNNHYRYQRGYFYRPYGATFQIAIPPFGIRISTLPLGYRRFNVGPDPYYYYNGTYYRPYGEREYEVVAPPLGAVVNKLPPGAKVTVIDGQKYYELKGTYYQEEITADNELQYTVVGTDGVLNTGEAAVPQGPVVGDRMETLPADSKAVVINGEKLYAAPSGLYYKEIIEGNKVYYEVVGK